MNSNYIDVGDTVAESPVGPGEVTAITQAGYPQVNHVAVVWIKRTDGVLWDPRNKYNVKHKGEECLTA